MYVSILHICMYACICLTIYYACMYVCMCICIYVCIWHTVVQLRLEFQTSQHFNKQFCIILFHHHHHHHHHHHFDVQWSLMPPPSSSFSLVPNHRLRSSQITLTGEMFWEDCDTTLSSECKLFLVFFCHFVFSPLSGFFFIKTKEIQLDDLFCTRSFQLTILSIYHLSIHPSIIVIQLIVNHSNTIFSNHYSYFTVQYIVSINWSSK